MSEGKRNRTMATLLGLTLLLTAGSLGCGGHVKSSPESMTDIKSRRDLETLKSQPRAFVFLWVAWAAQAQVSQAAVHKLQEAWRESHPDCAAKAYRIDVSEQKGESWDAVRQWLADQNQSPRLFMYSGVGPLFWMRGGTVVGSVGYAGERKLADLVSDTAGYFDCR